MGTLSLAANVNIFIHLKWGSIAQLIVGFDLLLIPKLVTAKLTFKKKLAEIFNFKSYQNNILQKLLIFFVTFKVANIGT